MSFSSFGIFWMHWSCCGNRSALTSLKYREFAAFEERDEQQLLKVPARCVVERRCALGTLTLDVWYSFF